jgi:urease accessory protein
MLTLRTRIGRSARVDHELVLTCRERERSRFLAKLASGEEVGVMLERGAALRDGDCLRAEEGAVVRIVAADEEVMEARAGDSRTLARVAYHLGNRHAQIEIRDGCVRFAADDVLAQMVRMLGAEVRALRAPFQPEPGAYGGAHHSHSGEAKHSGIIHEMLANPSGRAR